MRSHPAILRIIGHLLVVVAAVLAPAASVFGGFASPDLFFPAVGRVAGQGGAQFYTTIWVTNLSSSDTVHFTFQFLKGGQGNAGTVPSFDDTLAPGETKIYENVVEEKLGLGNALGAGRITADGEVFAAERIYNQAHADDDLGTTEGLFFAGVPASFAIGLGESASVQGVNQGDPSEDMRTNFALVETAGASATVHVALLDHAGTTLGSADYPLDPYEQIQPNVAQLFSGIATKNARLVATVTAGAGRVIIAAAQLANTSQDSSGFEMSFKDSLLGGGGGGAGVASLNGLTGTLSLVAGTNVTITKVGSTALKIDATGGSGGAGVSSLNTLTGALSITAGDGISVTPSGKSIQVAYTGGGSSGINSVTHDATLAGAGTGASPLGIAAGGVGLPQLSAAGSASGQVLTSNGAGVAWQTPAAGGGLTLPYSGTGSTDGINAAFQLSNTGTGLVIKATNSNSNNQQPAIQGLNTYWIGVQGDGVLGVKGSSLGNGNGACGVFGRQGQGTAVNYTGGVCADSFYSPAMMAASYSNKALIASTHSNYTIYATNDGASAPTIYGGNQSGMAAAFAVLGEIVGTAGNSATGVKGVADSNNGSGLGVWGEAQSGYGVYGQTSTGLAGKFAGPVDINGTVHTSAAGAVKFDDPRDPANATVSHAFVTSSEMKNVYDGTVTLDPSGVAEVVLPDWFETLNRDFRYQLTAIGTPQPGLFVARKVAGNRFRIAGGVGGAEVSWQVTGVRKDPWAAAHPMAVAKPKPETDRGLYIDPELYGQPKTKSTDPVQRRTARIAAGEEEY